MSSKGEESLALADITAMLAKLRSELALAVPINVNVGSPASPLDAAIEDNFVLVRMSMNMLAKLALLGESQFGNNGKGRDVMGYRVVIELGGAKEGVTNNRGRREPVYTPTISIEPIPEEKPLVTMSSAEPPPAAPYEPDSFTPDYTYEGAYPPEVEKPL